MSHFTVTVVTAEQPTDEILRAALQPFHEFECTGTDDQYVVDVDKTEEARSTYAADTTSCLKAADGSLHSFFTEDGNWVTKFSQLGEHGRRKKFVPNGYTEVTVPTSELQTFVQFLRGYYSSKLVQSEAEIDRDDEHKYGYTLVDGNGEVIRYIDRTNPNAKWDWWVIGGRWSGQLKHKNGSQVDQVSIADLDLDGMRSAGSNKAGALWDKVQPIVAGLEPARSWEDVQRDRTVDGVTNWDAARKAYHDQAMVKALNEAFPKNWGIDNELAAATSTREAFCLAGADAALPTFALLLDGTWYERGEMGLFACVANEKPAEQWNAEFSKKIAELPATAWLTVVDCHI